MEGQWFGYQAVKDAEMAWGARAIFRPSFPTACLDTLPDRQGYLGYEKPGYLQFADFIQRSCIAKLNELASNFSADDRHHFVWHFEWPHDSRMVVVAQGSPNGSFGYFYLSVSLVDKNKAPEILRPVGYMTAEEQKAASRRLQEQMRVNDQKQRAFTKTLRSTRKELRAKNATEIGDTPVTPPGQPLSIGSHVMVEANQGQRDAIVRSISGNEALVRYFMPNGKAFLRIINAATQADIRSVSEKSIPKRFVM